MLNFCPNCDNLYTYVHTPDRKMVMKCQGCGKVESDIQNTCIYLDKLVQHSYDIKIQPDQCYDNTLPHTDQIKCLNADCPSNKSTDVSPDIVFFHYNEDMKLAYICCMCQTYWKNWAQRNECFWPYLFLRYSLYQTYRKNWAQRNEFFWIFYGVVGLRPTQWLSHWPFLSRKGTLLVYIVFRWVLSKTEKLIRSTRFSLFA